MVKHLHKKVVKFSNLLLIFAVIILAGATFYNRVFPDLLKYFFLVIILFSLFLVFSNVNRTLKAILAVLLIIFAWLTFYTQYTVDKLLRDVKYETSTISMYVLKSASQLELISTSTFSAGISDQMDDELSTYFRGEVAKVSAGVVFEKFDNEITGYEKLLNHELDAIAVDNNIIETILEVYPDFPLKTRIIYSIDKEHEIEDPIVIEEPTGDSFVVYLSGIDTTGPITNRSRSDVNILLSVNLKTSKVTIVSIPRDTYVDLACKGDKKDKLTHSGIYGIGCSIDTIEQLIGIDINYYVKVNFTSFIKIVDVIGPIKVYSAYDFLTYKKGINVLDAKQALAFARERYSFPNGDVQRGLNQQQVIIGVINKLIEPTSLAKTDKIVSSVAKSIETNINSELINKLVNHQLSKNLPWSFESLYLKGKGDYQPTYSMGSRLLYVYWPDEASLIEIQTALKTSLNE